MASCEKDCDEGSCSLKSPVSDATTAVAGLEQDLEANLNSGKRRSWWSRATSLLWISRSRSEKQVQDNDEAYTTVTRILDTTPEGYSRVATFQSSDQNFLQYRGFSYLHARLLSDLQFEVECLERELDKLDTWDKENDGMTRLYSSAKDKVKRTKAKMPEGFPLKRTRPEVLVDLKAKLMDYGKHEVLLKSREMTSLQRPSERDYRSVLNWFADKKPLVDRERQFIRRKEDIITLRTGRECAAFDSFVERSLSRVDDALMRINCPIIRTLFMTPELQIKTQDENLHYYSPTRVNTLVNIIITTVIFALLVLPVVAMYEVTSIGRRASPFDAIGILIVFTLVFGAAMSSLTKATRQELFAASAAYCAVLVVFISNFTQHTVSV